MKLIDRLYEKSKENMGVCLGLDTTIDALPDYINEMDIPLAEKFLMFNKIIIEETKNDVACYKVQIACYEALGIEGLKCYAETLKHIKKSGNIVIADIKRGDISSTAKLYAKAHFEGDFEADFITVNMYMGEDAISPYYDYIKNSDKGLFVLVKTSNEKSYEIQDLKLEGGGKVYEKVAKYVDNFGKEFISESGFSAIGAVCGLTHKEDFKIIKKQMPNTFFLVPGYGAQGASAEDMKDIFSSGICAVINSSRGIIKAHKGKEEGRDFYKYIKMATLNMKEDIKKWLK